MKESNKVFVVRTTQEERHSVEETEKKDLVTMSWMSWILRLLIKLHLVPVTWDGQNSTLDFHLWSKALFLSCSVTIVTVGGLFSFFILGGLFSTMLSREINFIDKAILFVIRDGHTDADIRINFCIIRQYCAISDICRIMRISASMRIAKNIRMAIPNDDRE